MSCQGFLDTTKMIRKTDEVFEVGLDVKYGITSNLTGDFTLNTDFAQVESDEEQVNLTRFSLFFPEKRPFFLEGAFLFEVGVPRPSFRRPPPLLLFYSRRIGIEEGYCYSDYRWREGNRQDLTLRLRLLECVDR